MNNCTILAIARHTEAGPTYTAVDILYDHGRQYFKLVDDRPSHAGQLFVYLIVTNRFNQQSKIKTTQQPARID